MPYHRLAHSHDPMSATHLQTTSLKLIPLTPEEVRARVEAMAPSEKAQVSTRAVRKLERGSICRSRPSQKVPGTNFRRL